MSDLPKSWEFLPMLDILPIVQTGVASFAGEVSYFSTGSIQHSFATSEGTYTFETRPARANRWMLEGDVIQARMKETDKAFLIDSNYSKSLFSTGFLHFRPKPNVYNSKLLKFYLASKEFLDQRDEFATGSTQEALTDANARKLTIPLPPLNEQKRIVEKLEKLLGKVEAVQARLDKIPAILKRFRQAILAAACSGKLTADWRKENSKKTAEQLKQDIIFEFYQKTKKKIDETEYFQKPDSFDIPSSWQWIISANLFHFVTSGSRGWARYYSDSGALFIRVGNLDHDSIQLDLSSKKFVNPPSNAEGTRTRVFQNDILVSITADVGMIALVNSDIGEAYINQHISLARPVEIIDKKFLAYYLTSEDGGQKQFRELQRGATKAGLGLNDIKSIWVALPPIEEQKEIVRRVEDLFKFADQIEARYKKARSYTDKLTQSILAKAFRGELVPQDETDEPADILLERIKADKVNNTNSVKVKRKRKSKEQKEDKQQTLFAKG